MFNIFQIKRVKVGQSLTVRIWNGIKLVSALSPRQTDPQVHASRRKFAKPELAYGLAKGGQIGLQVTKKRKFHAYHWLMRFYNNRLLAINLCRLALGGQTVKNLCPIWAQPKSTQVHASGWPNETQVERKSQTCVDLRVCLARALYNLLFIFHIYFFIIFTSHFSYIS